MFEQKVFARASIRITNFLVSPKIGYDNGYCDYIILLTEGIKVSKHLLVFL